MSKSNTDASAKRRSSNAGPIPSVATQGTGSSIQTDKNDGEAKSIHPLLVFAIGSFVVALLGATFQAIWSASFSGAFQGLFIGAAICWIPLLMWLFAEMMRRSMEQIGKDAGCGLALIYGPAIFVVNIVFVIAGLLGVAIYTLWIGLFAWVARSLGYSVDTETDLLELLEQQSSRPRLKGPEAIRRVIKLTLLTTGLFVLMLTATAILAMTIFSPDSEGYVYHGPEDEKHNTITGFQASPLWQLLLDSCQPGTLEIKTVAGSDVRSAGGYITGTGGVLKLTLAYNGQELSSASANAKPPSGVYYDPSKRTAGQAASSAVRVALWKQLHDFEMNRMVIQALIARGQDPLAYLDQVKMAMASPWPECVPAIYCYGLLGAEPKWLDPGPEQRPFYAAAQPTGARESRDMLFSLLTEQPVADTPLPAGMEDAHTILLEHINSRFTDESAAAITALTYLRATDPSIIDTVAEHATPEALLCLSRYGSMARAAGPRIEANIQTNKYGRTTEDDLLFDTLRIIGHVSPSLCYRVTADSDIWTYGVGKRLTYLESNTPLSGDCIIAVVRGAVDGRQRKSAEMQQARAQPYSDTTRGITQMSREIEFRKLTKTTEEISQLLVPSAVALPDDEVEPTARGLHELIRQQSNLESETVLLSYVKVLDRAGLQALRLCLNDPQVKPSTQSVCIDLLASMSNVVDKLPERDLDIDTRLLFIESLMKKREDSKSIARHLALVFKSGTDEQKKRAMVLTLQFSAPNGTALPVYLVALEAQQVHADQEGQTLHLVRKIIDSSRGYTHPNKRSMSYGSYAGWMQNDKYPAMDRSILAPHVIAVFEAGDVSAIKLLPSCGTEGWRYLLNSERLSGTGNSQTIHDALKAMAPDDIRQIIAVYLHKEIERGKTGDRLEAIPLLVKCAPSSLRTRAILQALTRSGSPRVKQAAEDALRSIEPE